MMHVTCHAAWHQSPAYELQWQWLALVASAAVVEIAEKRLLV